MSFLKKLWTAAKTTVKAVAMTTVAVVGYIGAPGVVLGASLVHAARSGWRNIQTAWQLGLADWRAGRRFRGVAVMVATISAAKLALVAILLLIYGLLWGMVAGGIFFVLAGWPGIVLAVLAAFLWNLSALYLEGGVYDGSLI